MMNSKFNQGYLNQVKLLVSILPVVAEETCFCLKGGTAINLFLRDMPRLSVDIDLVYLPINDREAALHGIENGLTNIKNKILNLFPGVEVTEKRDIKNHKLSKLYIRDHQAQIVIEPNNILRGSLHPVEKRHFSPHVEAMLQLSASNVPILHFSEIYAGKICAALDRQHPRDLFDVKLLYENEGLTEEIRKAFVVYLASGSRPIHELLVPNLLENQPLFDQEFLGMSTAAVSYKDLLSARQQLIKDVDTQLTQEERSFLLSIARGEPNYALMPFSNLHLLPAIKWKVMNIGHMEGKKRKHMEDKLKLVLKV